MISAKHIDKANHKDKNQKAQKQLQRKHLQVQNTKK
jgi:hypothetical protein